MAEKEIKVRITGDASQLGVESRKATESLNSVKSAATSLVAGFTGGLIGGGIAGAVTSAVGLIANQIAAARQLLRDARSADLDTDFLAGSRFFAERINAPANTVEQAVANARQARADALGGDANAIDSFRRLGISLREIEGLAPDELFFRIAEAFRDADLSRSRLAGSAGVLGTQQAQALVPYFAGGAGGDRLNLAELFRGDFANIALRNSGIYQGNIEAMLAGDRYKRSIEPISMAGVGDEERANRMARENDQRALAVKRATLSIEEQIAAVTQQRTELERAAARETNSVKREQIRADMIGLDAELVRLQQQDAARMKPGLRGFERQQTDELAQRGLFIGGTPRVQVVQEQQLDQLRQAVTEIRNLRNDQKGLW